ncbi:MAG TPA: TIR domain-containing protein [Streptosporangiaceae bacterium]|jgi:nucleoside phosphorylase
MPRAYDLGLLIPSREEFDCAREVLDFGDAFRQGGYFLHPFTVPDSKLSGVALVLFDVGLANAAVATTNLLSLVDLRQVAMIGVASALDEGLRPGDVVIASGVDEYMRAAKADAGEFQVGGNVWNASHQLVSFANNFRYLNGDYQVWRDRTRSRAPASEPDYRVGQIASGDIGGAAIEFRQWLLHHNRRRVALEMGAAGATEAIYHSGRTDLLVIRGIANRPDRNIDNAGWIRVAALNAVDLLGALVTNSDFPWPKPPAASTTVPESAKRPEPTGDGPKHVFLSYAHEDTDAVDQLQEALEAAGIQVWRDTKDLLPGQDLRSTIRKAITGSAFVFITCFSAASVALTKSHQNEELMLAIEEVRQRRIDQPWLIPVRLDACEVPDREIGGGRTLRSLVWIDLFGPTKAQQTQRLVRAVQQNLSLG